MDSQRKYLYKKKKLCECIILNFYKWYGAENATDNKSNVLKHNN